MPTPAIVRLRSGALCVYAGRVPSGLCRLVDPISHAVTEIPLEELGPRECGGQALLIARRVGGAGVDPKTFGMRWFLPTVWRYRRPLGHVLAASLFVQIFALTTPLIFQVIVDKVLTHKGYETLFVMIAGLVVIGLFDVALQYLRTYALSHTTNRIDVELGQRLFAHLLRLPMGYFETRSAGQTVARVRELETIRTFLTGQGLFSAIDFVFAFVFIAVMFAYSASLDADRSDQPARLHSDRLPRQAAAARSGEREVQSRRGEPAVPGRDGRRSRHDQGRGGRADHAGAVGREARRLREDGLRRHDARLGRAARHPIRQQAHHRRRPAVRRQGGDRRRTQRRGARRLQHDRLAGGAADPPAVADLAGFPAGADLGRASRRHPQRAAGTLAADASGPAHSARRHRIPQCRRSATARPAPRFSRTSRS